MEDSKKKEVLLEMKLEQKILSQIANYLVVEHLLGPDEQIEFLKIIEEEMNS